MKREKTNTLWYNGHDKEIGGIVLEAREDIIRRTRPYPDVRACLRMMGVYSSFQTTIL